MIMMDKVAFTIIGAIFAISGVRDVVGQIPSPPIETVPSDKWADQIEDWRLTIDGTTSFLVNTASLTVKSLMADRTIGFYIQNQQCFGCEVQLRGLVPASGNISGLHQSSYGNTIELLDMTHASFNNVICVSDLESFRERGDYWLMVFEDAPMSGVTCDLVLANDPENYNLPVLYAFLVFFGAAVFWIVTKKLYTHGKCKCRTPSQNSLDITDITRSTVALEMNGSSDTIAQEKNTSNGPAPNSSPQAAKTKQRLVSLDAFRGLSLTIMIFVNYGGGGYWYFQHAHWDGLFVADLVFPWFVWIMGVSISFAFRGMLKRGKPKWRIFLKILDRSVKIFAIGLFMGARNTPDVNTMRIPGVLQRLAFTYLVTASVHLIFAEPDGVPKFSRSCKTCCPSLRDVLVYWPEWIIMLAILGLQVALTYGLPVPGCPKGYVGPGGLHDGGQYFNCTGGAAGYIDQLILSNDHIYQWPTIKEIYKTEMAFDPEGILGTLTSIFMCYLGLQAGKIITTYKSHTSRIVRWLIWGLLTGALGTLLCQAKQTDGWMPLNKNLWSVSFILALSGMAYLILILFYVIIDVAHLWTGAPFIYPGMNSIVIYVCHSVFGSYFPVAWQWPDYTLHWQQLFRALWGTTIWVVVAFAMYFHKVFVAL